jgi:SAM-dependent methyltransferase
MMAQLQDWSNLYQKELLLGFYKKRGKAITIPHIIHAVDRLLVNKSKDPIRILDVGCGKGDLLSLLSNMIAQINESRKVELFGLDREKHLLEIASEDSSIDANFFYKDLSKIKSSDFINKFDLIIATNTLHEVFSDFFKRSPKKDTIQKFNQAKEQLKIVIQELSQMLSGTGSILIYDGLAPTEFKQTVKFKLKKIEILDLLDKFCAENKTWKIKYQKQNNYIQMSQLDFMRFVTTFKYLGSNLWQIEREENYFYFSFEEYKQLLINLNLILDSTVLVNNDLNLYNHYFELIEPADFPFKSLLIMASKKYLPLHYKL